MISLGILVYDEDRSHVRGQRELENFEVTV